MPKSRSVLTRRRAEAHEALWPRLAVLSRQVEAMALRHPGAAIPAATLALARRLIGEAQAFSRQPLPRPGPEAAAGEAAGLAAQLGQALATLDAFEVANSHWEPGMACIVWTLRDQPLPVARLRQKVARPLQTEKDRREHERMRDAILRRIEERADNAYAEGYAHGAAGQPSKLAGTEADW